MPTLPWISSRPTDPGASAVMMASRFRLARLRQVPRFFVDAMRIHRQVRKAEGALGVSLVAHPDLPAGQVPPSWDEALRRLEAESGAT